MSNSKTGGTQKVRVIRVLEYVGTREWVESSMERRFVKGIMGSPIITEGVIREAIVGEFPEIVDGSP